MDKLKILYFLEDRAQEGFIVSLVDRVASELSIPKQALWHQVMSSRGGTLKVVGEFGEFVQDRRKAGVAGAEMIIVAVDGDCKGHAEMVRQLMRRVKDTDPFRDILVFAIPDPHIERWYLLDQAALKNGTGLRQGIPPPRYKCEKNYYKNIVRDALRQQGVTSLVGGSEFGPEIARNMSDLYIAGKKDRSFEKFVEDVKAILRRTARRVRKGK